MQITSSLQLTAPQSKFRNFLWSGILDHRQTTSHNVELVTLLNLISQYTVENETMHAKQYYAPCKYFNLVELDRNLFSDFNFIRFYNDYLRYCLE